MKPSFVVQNLQIAPHVQTAVELDSEDTALLGIELDSVPLGNNCLLTHSIERQASHDSVAMAFAGVIEIDYFGNRCST